MRLSFAAATFALAGVLSGCSASAPPASVSVASGPHQGTMIRLPEDKGFVELVNEPEVTDRRNPPPTSIVAYYLQTDAESPLMPAPSDVSFAIGSGGGKSAGGTKGGVQSIPLNAEPKSAEPAGASRFASKPGPYQLSAIRGNLNAKISGLDITISFEGAR
jgi:hypothetical protein